MHRIPAIWKSRFLYRFGKMSMRRGSVKLTPLLFRSVCPRREQIPKTNRPHVASCCFIASFARSLNKTLRVFPVFSSRNVKTLLLACHWRILIRRRSLNPFPPQVWKAVCSRFGHAALSGRNHAAGYIDFQNVPPCMLKTEHLFDDFITWAPLGQSLSPEHGKNTVKRKRAKTFFKSLLLD